MEERTVFYSARPDDNRLATIEAATTDALKARIALKAAQYPGVTWTVYRLETTELGTAGIETVKQLKFNF